VGNVAARRPQWRPRRGWQRRGLLVHADAGACSGLRQQDDFEVYDDDGIIGRIYRANANVDLWFWGTNSLHEAKAAFQIRYRARNTVMTDD
jgi:hypothetical protein